MKNLGRTIIVILGISILSFQSKAADTKENAENLECIECHRGHDYSALTTFKEVVHTFHTASGQFQNLNEEKQAAFISAAEVMKKRISILSNGWTTEKLDKIDFAVNLFRFLWDNKSTPVEIDFDMEVPVAPVLS